MADILTKCRKCGRETTVSEYAAAGGVKCPGCGAPLEFQNTVANQSRLQVRRIDQDRNGKLTAETDARPVARDEEVIAAQRIATAQVFENVHKTRQKTRTPLAIWNWVAFAALAGLLIGSQWYTTVIDTRFFHYYHWGRLGIWGLVSLLVLIVAFEDGTGQGLLCLFVPLYILYYAVVRVEYYWLRGLFIAVVVGMGAELYYLEDRAALVVTQEYINRFIVGVGDTIERVGSESPEITRPAPRPAAPTSPTTPSRPEQPRNVPRPGRRH